MRERLDRHVNAAQIVRFPFRHDTPGLADGVVVYTPTPGEVLLDAWFEIDEAWNGTTPMGDIGTFVNTTSGLFIWPFLPIDMTVADAENPNGYGGEGMLWSPAPPSATPNAGAINSTLLSNADAAATAQHTATGGNGAFYRTVPLKFIANHPLKVVVSQDGAAGSADPGATQGEATLFLLVAPA